MSDQPPFLILGTRSFNDKKIPLRSRFGNIVTSRVLKLLCGITVNDTQTGLRGIPLSVMDILLTIEGERFEYEMNMILEAKERGYSLIQLPIKTIYISNNESSHFNPLIDSLKIYKTILKYAFTSLFSVIIDFSIFTFCFHYTSGVIISTYIGRLASAVVNFSLNKNIVFKAKGNLIRQLIRYISLVFMSGSCSALLILIITKILNIYNLLLVKALVEFVLFFANYYLQNSFVFMKPLREKMYERN